MTFCRQDVSAARLRLNCCHMELCMATDQPCSALVPLPVTDICCQQQMIFLVRMCPWWWVLLNLEGSFNVFPISPLLLMVSAICSLHIWSTPGVLLYTLPIYLGNKGFSDYHLQTASDSHAMVQKKKGEIFSLWLSSVGYGMDVGSVILTFCLSWDLNYGTCYKWLLLLTNQGIISCNV